MKLNDYFDKIYCINLDHRTDRWEECQKIFEKNEIICERISAKDGNEIGLYNPFKYELANSISHLSAIKKAKENNFKNVLIFEDDFEIIENFNDEFEKKISDLPTDWDVVYFGGNHTQPVEIINDNIGKMSWSYAVHMYGVNGKFFDNIISYMDSKINGVLDGSVSLNPSVGSDYFYAQIQKDYNFYTIRPYMSWQREGFSDIQQKFYNYDWLLKRGC